MVTLQHHTYTNTMPIENLISHFAQYIPLKEVEKNGVKQRFIERKVKRRQFILVENEFCRHYTFVVSGCFKMYKEDDNASEHIIQFAAENEWIMDINSFHSGKESRLYIEAIEPSIILQIDQADLIYLYHNYPKFDRIFRIMVENKHNELQNRVLQNISSTAVERYFSFLAHYPNLSNRLPNTLIASYIGITPEFLSKIRRISLRK